MTFIKLKCRWVKSVLHEFKKNAFLLRVDFSRIFKNIAFFKTFKDF